MPGVRGPAHLTLEGMRGAFREAEPGGGNQGGIFIGPGTSHVTLEDMDALIKVLCYARTYEIGSPEAGEYQQIPEHLQRILDRAAAESK